MVSCSVLEMKDIIFKIKVWFYNHFKHITIAGGGNCSIRKFRLASCGKGNRVILGDNVRLNDVEIKIYGNGNLIYIDSNNTFTGIRFAIEDDNNEIRIASYTYIGTGSLLATLETTKITIGRDCMIAGPCEMRTSDSHSLTDLEGSRINSAKSICIGNHVWIGAGCMLLKGCSIPDDSIIAARSVLTSTKGLATHSLWGGSPAKLLKTEVNWKKERI